MELVFWSSALFCFIFSGVETSVVSSPDTESITTSTVSPADKVRCYVHDSTCSLLCVCAIQYANITDIRVWFLFFIFPQTPEEKEAEEREQERESRTARVPPTLQRTDSAPESPSGPSTDGKK